MTLFLLPTTKSIPSKIFYHHPPIFPVLIHCVYESPEANLLRVYDLQTFSNFQSNPIPRLQVHVTPNLFVFVPKACFSFFTTLITNEIPDWKFPFASTNQPAPDYHDLISVYTSKCTAYLFRVQNTNCYLFNCTFSFFHLFPNPISPFIQFADSSMATPCTRLLLALIGFQHRNRPGP